jgi:hypothetical protein
MKRPDVNLVLDEALRKLQSGVPLDQVLAECGEYAAELAPLLEAALWMQQSAQPTVPQGGMARSRARFLQTAEANSAKALPFFTRFRWAVNLAVILLVLASALFFTGMGSVSALPGQTLYPVKRAVEQARLALASSDPAGKLLLEENFDGRRVDEVLRLAERGRGQRVNFAGFLSGGGGQPWMVEGILLDLTDAQQSAALSLAGSYVEVQGQVQPDGRVLVSELQLRFFELEGRLAQQNGERWLINGAWVAITAQTQVDLQPAVGQTVKITAIRLSTQDFLALTVRLEDGPEKEQVEGSASAQADTNEDRTSTAESGGSTSETDEPAVELSETPKPGETGEVKETNQSGGDHEEEATRTREPSRTPEQTRTSEPTRTQEPTRTPEPTKTPDK